MRVRDIYYMADSVDKFFIMTEFSMRYEEYDIEDYFDRDVYGIHAIDKNTLGLKVEGKKVR